MLTLLLFTFVCAALYQGFARSGDYCEPSVDPFFTSSTDSSHYIVDGGANLHTDYSAAQAGWWWLENAAPAA